MTSGSLISADRSLETPRVRALPSQPASKTPAPQPWTRALRPWASTLILALLPFTALAQANFQLGDVITRDQVGARAELPLVLTHAGRAPASFTVDVDFDSANLNFITIRPAAALTTLTKNLIQSLPQAGKLRISVSGNPSAPLPQGLIATIVFEAATAPVRLSTRALQISNSSALDITSASLTVTSQPGQIRFRERPGDADLNDIVNALDLQVLINSILGLTTPPPPPTDVNLDGNVNALDLQLTINGILGVPILSSLSSTSLVNGAALFVTGNNFYGSTPGRVVVALNGSDATPFFVDDRNLAILVPATATTGALALRDTVTSNLSGPLSITLTSPPPPAAPSMTSAAAMGTTSISLTWFDESGTETGFRVERRNFPSGSFATVANLASDVTSYLDSTLAPNTSYEFRVFAFNLSGSSAASPAASATTAGAPAISAIIPNRGSSTKSTDVQIIGSNLTAGSQILIGGDPVLEPVFISPSLIIARTPIASAAERGQQVAVSLSGGNSLPAAWLYLTETRPLDVTASIPASFTPTAPISTSVAFRLSEQVDAATVTNPNTSATGNTAFFNSATPRQPLAGQARLSEDGLWIVLDTTLALTSSANQNLPLIVGGSSGIRDIFGNTLGTTNTTLGANPAFTASFVSNQAADTISPTLLSSSPAAGASNIARAASFEIIFSEALDPSSLRLNGASPSIGLTVSGGPAIPAKLKLSLDGRRIELTPLSAMSPSTMVRLSLNAGVTDLSGNALAPQNLDFTTRATSSLSLISVAPNLGSLGGDESIVLDGEGFAGFAEVLIGGRPASRIEVLSSSRIRCATPAASLPGPVDVSISFAGSTPITLASGFTYREDLSPSGSIQRPELLFEFPPAADDGSLPVAANSAYVLVYSEPLDISASSIGYGFDAPISLVQNNFTMNGSVSVVPNSRNRILLVRPSQNLSGTIRLFLSSFESFDNSGIKDTDGNRMLTFHADAFSQIGFGDAGFIFQWTGAAADSTPPTISSRSPTANSVIGPRDPIRIRFNEEIDPNAINGSFFSDSQGIVPGTIELELDSLRALTFRPSRDYSGTVTVNPAGIKDLAGNNTSSTTYTLTAGSDTLAPVITRLTVNNLPGSLNGAAANGGSAPSGQGLIQVPTSGFTIDLDVTELGGSGLDLDASQLTFSVAAGALSAGSNVLAALPSAFKSFDGERLTILIPEALALTPQRQPDPDPDAS
jgi:hypothetical protein